MHFHLVLLTHSLLESSCHTVRKPILVYEERLHGEEISLTRPQTSWKQVTYLPYCALFESLTYRITSIIK